MQAVPLRMARGWHLYTPASIRADFASRTRGHLAQSKNMFKCFVGIAKSSRQVEVALDDLQKNGSIAADISVFMPNSGETPELGPVKGTRAPKEADGSLMAALTGGGAGAHAGGVAGALVRLGIPEDEAKAYEDPVKEADTS